VVFGLEAIRDELTTRFFRLEVKSVSFDFAFVCLLLRTFAFSTIFTTFFGEIAGRFKAFFSTISGAAGAAGAALGELTVLD
jgi:hypothetical protein